MQLRSQRNETVTTPRLLGIRRLDAGVRILRAEVACNEHSVVGPSYWYNASPALTQSSEFLCQRLGVGGLFVEQRRSARTPAGSKAGPRGEDRAMQHEPNATDAPAVLKISEVINDAHQPHRRCEGARKFLRTDGAAGIPCRPSRQVDPDSRASSSGNTSSSPSPPTNSPTPTTPPTPTATTTTSRTRTTSPTTTRTINASTTSPDSSPPDQPVSQPHPSRSNDKSRTNTRQQNQTVARGQVRIEMLRVRPIHHGASEAIVKYLTEYLTEAIGEPAGRWSRPPSTRTRTARRGRRGTPPSRPRRHPPAHRRHARLTVHDERQRQEGLVGDRIRCHVLCTQDAVDHGPCPAMTGSPNATTPPSKP